MKKVRALLVELKLTVQGKKLHGKNRRLLPKAFPNRKKNHPKEKSLSRFSSVPMVPSQLKKRDLLRRLKNRTKESTLRLREVKKTRIDRGIASRVNKIGRTRKEGVAVRVSHSSLTKIKSKGISLIAGVGLLFLIRKSVTLWNSALCKSAKRLLISMQSTPWSKNVSAVREMFSSSILCMGSIL